MKVIREAEFSECGECGTRRMVLDKSFGCDQCGKEIDLARRHADYIGDLTVFRRGDERTTSYHFCTVECTVKFIASMRLPKDLDFVSFPLLSGATKVRKFQRALRAGK
jgi:hypothetical protein